MWRPFRVVQPYGKDKAREATSSAITIRPQTRSPRSTVCSPGWCVRARHRTPLNWSSSMRTGRLCRVPARV